MSGLGTQVADAKDAARTGSSCLHVMENRIIFIGLLRALGFDTLQGLWGFIKFYDTIGPMFSSPSLALRGTATLGLP